MNRKYGNNIDIHKIRTNFFNVNLKPFIINEEYTKVGVEYEYEYKSGKVKREKTHEFKPYVDWLDTHIEEVFDKIPPSDTIIGIDKLREYLGHLVKFFVNVSLLNEIRPNQE